MNRRVAILSGFVAVMMLFPLAGRASGSHITQLKVCGDPDNLPFSNKKSEGFENKIAEVIAKELGTDLTYFWWPHQRGLVRRALRPGLCDVMPSKRVLRTVLKSYGQDRTKIYDADGRFTGRYRHVLKVFLVDHAGQVRNIYSTGSLVPQVMVNDIKTVLADKIAASPDIR